VVVAKLLCSPRVLVVGNVGIEDCTRECALSRCSEDEVAFSCLALSRSRLESFQSWEPLGGIVTACWSVLHFPVSVMFSLYRCSLSRGLLEVP
jgi:hypothetical protein